MRAGRGSEASNTPLLYLASASPRRRELLASVGLRFTVMPADVDEIRREHESAEQFVLRVAAAKAERVSAQVARARSGRYAVIAADTCVAVEGEVFGKPEDAAAAAVMLRRLSGRSHEVITAVVLDHDDNVRAALSRSVVTFKALSDGEIRRYCNTGESLDKAGAYAIQGLAGGFVERLEGSYTGVVGLPMFELRNLLLQIGVDWI